MNAKVTKAEKKQPAQTENYTPIDLNNPIAETAEQVLLGMLILNAETWDTLNFRLDVTDFYKPQHRHIYEATFNLYKDNKVIDPISVIEELRLRDKLAEAGGKDYVSSLAANAIQGEPLNSYAEIVYDRSLRRRFIMATEGMMAKAKGKGSEDIQALLMEAEQEIFDLADKNKAKTSNIVSVSEELKRVIAEIDYNHRHQDSISGQSTGFKYLDDLTSGFQNADFVVLAGRPSMGKTSFALNIAASVSVNEKQASLIFSLEMPTSMLIMRLISILGSVNLARLRDGRLSETDWLKIRQAGEMLDGCPIYVDDSVDLNPQTIRSRIRRVKRMLPEDVDLGLVVVDYLQLMQLVHTNENRVNEIAEISRSLKGIAKEFEIPVLALSQLNRGVESRENKRPTMSDLRDSGAIEQDADLILFIYRDEVYRKDEPANKGVAEIIIAKHRNGPTGMVKLAFQAENASFANLEYNKYEDMEVAQGFSDEYPEAKVQSS